MGNENKEKTNKSLYKSFSNKTIDSHTIPEDSFLTHGHPPKMKITKSSIDSRNKPGWSRSDFDAFRPEERLPVHHKDIIASVQMLYKKIGIVRNVIDLMADFASEGLQIEHPIKSQRRFYDKWAKKVNLSQRAHDYMKLFIRDGNVIVRRKNAKISVDLASKMVRSVGSHRHRSLSPFTHISNIPVFDSPDTEKPENVGVDKFLKKEKRVIPWRYIFISPTMVEKISGHVGKFFGSDDIGIKLHPALVSSIKKPKNESEKSFVKKLPNEIKDAVKSKNAGSHILIKLKPEFMWIDYYKKDDWEEWATPFLYAVLEDVLFKNKMRTADMAALDGVINVIRLWKLGNSDQKILPTSNAVNKLLDILQNNVGGGSTDIVWDDMIDLQVEYPPIDKILGPDKYKSVDRDILQGLGIPTALVGGEGIRTGSQAAFVQLKTLVERLEYVRTSCIKWLNNELGLVKRAMGWSVQPQITFGNMSLRDEVGEKKLILQMLDRNIISIETVHKVFGNNFIMELENLRDEQQIRAGEKPLIEKAGPFYRPESLIEKQSKTQIDLQKIKLGIGGDGGENPAGDLPKQEGNPPGRPLSTPDEEKRKDRTEVVMNTVYKSLADELMIKIDKIIDPKFLTMTGTKDKRSLTNKQSQQLEHTKWVILCGLTNTTKTDLTEEDINNVLKSISNKRVSKFNDLYQNMIKNFTLVKMCNPNLAQRRSLMSTSWSCLVDE